MRTILALICSFDKEGCEFRDEVGGRNKEGDPCPYCLDYNRRNPDEPLLVGKLVEAEYEYDKNE